MAKEFYLAEQDVDKHDRPTAWVISKDEKVDLIFRRLGQNWVLVHISGYKKIPHDDYVNARAVLPA